MQINLLRQLGIAARFVSGYYYFDMDEPAYELHAWVDVFTGNGWLGLDPMAFLQVILIFQLLQVRT
jgi:transglutaminase-like putative cysteine protease